MTSDQEHPRPRRTGVKGSELMLVAHIGRLLAALRTARIFVADELDRRGNNDKNYDMKASITLQIIKAALEERPS